MVRSRPFALVWALALVLALCALALAPGAVLANSASATRLPIKALAPNPPATTQAAVPAVKAPPQPRGGLKWRPTSVVVKGKHPVYVASMAHGSVGVMWLDSSQLKFRLVPGTHEPEGGPYTARDTRPSTWVTRMVAAFNGGFQLGDGVGGYFYNGTMVRPMMPGRAALVLSPGGQLRVAVWHGPAMRRGEGIITTTAGSVAIRQNLPPLVFQGKAMTRPSDNEATWGEADRGMWKVVRSAAGQLADGSIVYAYGKDVTPATMAAVMVSLHVRTAVMLDMNSGWPMGFFYDRPVGNNPPVGHRVHEAVWRDPESYHHQFLKDFIVAMTP